MFQNVKPPLTYEEQIKRFKEFHNLLIDDDEEALLILKKINYYRLSGYGNGLTLPNDKDKYRPGISLKHLYQLYTFDSKINCFPSQVLFSDRLGSKFNTLGINFDILGSDFNRWGKRSVFGSSPGDGGKCSDLQLRYGPGC